MNAHRVEASIADDLRKKGLYMRRLVEAVAIPGGLRACVSLIAFRDVGDERRPIIMSDEPLSWQTTKTHVPNTPAEVCIDESEATQQQIILEVQVLSTRIVRVRLGT